MVIDMSYENSPIETIINIKRNFIFTNNRYDSDAQFIGESVDFWQIVYIDKGEIVEKTKHKDFHLKENDILFLPPNTHHTPAFVEGKPKNASSFRISFECNSAALKNLAMYHEQLSDKCRLLMENLIDEGSKTFEIIKTPSSTSDDVVASMSIALTSPIGGIQAYKAYLELLLINILREHSQKSGTQIFISTNSNNRSLFEKSVHIMEENLYAEFTVKELCKRVGCSKSTLYTIFRKYANMSISSYYNMLKINEACQLIKKSKTTLKNISIMLNFNSQTYFAKTFKKYTGMSPSEYKKNYHFNASPSL